MGHVNFDPVSAVFKLLAGNLAELIRAVAKLCAFGNHNVWIVTLKRIAARDGDGASDNQESRTGNEAGIDGLFDSDVAVTGAFGFHVTQRGKALLQSATHRYRRTGCAIRIGMFEELNVVSTFRRIFSLEKDVGVRINQPGKNCDLCGKIDDRGVGRRRAALRYAFNPIAPNYDEDVVARLCGNTVNESGGTDGNDLR